VLVLGYGNPLRRDDGLGVALAETLAAEVRPGVEVRICHQLTPDLAEPVSRAAAVVFVDAAVDGPARVRLQRLRPHTGSSLGTHDCSPAGVLALAEALYGRVPPAWLLALPGEDFGLGEGFSPRGDESLRQGLDRLRRWLDRRCGAARAGD
jgi:hydrogenase maturation protease